MPDEELVSQVTRVYPTEWFSMPAFALETPALRVITVPAMGAKIVSIYDRVTEREWLLAPKPGRFRSVAYGTAFVEQDMSGWDEMFPTIDRCAYPVAGAYLGMMLPDHGEVWSQAWKQEKSTEAIHLTVQGRALPYTLSRTIGIIDERRLCLSYEVVNTGAEPLSVLWVAHPQFVADEATRIVLPASVTQVVSVLATAELPVIGQHYNWATATTEAGESLQLDRIRAASTQKHRKLYLPPDQHVEWAGLQHGKNGAWLRLSWNASEIPYLGIWVDEGSFNSAAIVALEPSTGYYDALSLAWQNQRAMVLPPGLSQHWSLNLELGNGVIS